MTTAIAHGPRSAATLSAPGAGGSRLPAIGLVAAVLAFTVDATTRVSLGPVSLSGAVTIVLTAAFLGLAPTVSGRAIGAVPVTLVAFSAYALARLVASPSSEGVQNVGLLVLFVLGMAYAARATGRSVARRYLHVMSAGGAVVAVVFLVCRPAGIDLIGTRPFALTALVLLACSVAVPSKALWAKIAPFVVVAAIVLSLSRTASAIAILLLIGLVVRMKRGRRWITAVLAFCGAAAASILVLTLFAPLRDRFLNGDNAATVGGVAINTSGRSAVWEAVWRRIAELPWFGHGPGSAAAFTTERFGITQPHNEYLRVLHDFGIVGMALFGFGLLAMIAATLRRALRTDERIHWAAFSALVAAALAAITDNVFVYPFVVVPLGVLVGLSLGARPSHHRPPSGNGGTTV